MFPIRDTIPAEFFSARPETLHRVFPKPTVLQLAGRRQPALFVSTLLHGNEHSGFFAVQRLLQQYSAGGLPRSLIIFLGNVSAAQQNLRFLPGQPDFNRIWRDCERPEGKAATEFLAWLAQRPLFAAVDLHDNSGLNPHYSCVTDMRAGHLQLAQLFSRQCIVSNTPSSTLTCNVADMAPTITAECGQMGNPLGADRAFRLLDALMHLEALPQTRPQHDDLVLYRCLGRFLIAPEAAIHVGDGHRHGFSLRPDLEHLNFTPLKVGTQLGTCADASWIGWERDEEAGDAAPIGQEFLAVRNNRVVVTREFTPAMLTLQERAIRSDCLGYVMEPITSG